MKFFIFTYLIQLLFGAPLVATGTSQSPGILSGNTVQVPINSPINSCGNSLNVIGAANPTTGNSCVNA
jgi:hypothetical protein